MADMTLSALAQDLRSSIHAAADVFSTANNEDFKRLIQAAALYHHQVRPRIKRGQITLISGQQDYPAPSDLIRVKSTNWGRSAKLNVQPWNVGYPKTNPKLRLVENNDGRLLEISTLPSEAELINIGTDCQYYYSAQHQVNDDADGTTIKQEDRALLLLRAQAEVCLELNLRGLNRPLSINNGITKKSQTGSPVLLAERLIALWHQSAGGQ